MFCTLIKYTIERLSAIPFLHAVGIITYDGTISITVAIDKVPGFEKVADRICADFEQRFELYLEAAEAALEHEDSTPEQRKKKKIS